jgi:predicted membrane channel-forming protein YqfA (hemolysin III family)
MKENFKLFISTLEIILGIISLISTNKITTLFNVSERYILSASFIILLTGVYTIVSLKKDDSNIQTVFWILIGVLVLYAVGLI